MYFHTSNPNTLAALAEAVTRADFEGRRFRVNVDADGNLTYKVGEGVWSAPFASEPDPYRDATPEPDGLVCDDCQGRDGKHFLNCTVWAWNQ